MRLLMSYLHSTMLLLYLNPAGKFHLHAFHLHSTMLLLYHIRDHAGDRPIKFTFHYASTLSCICSDSCSSYSAFTFHYASTLSEASSFFQSAATIYIPLCFYFISARSLCLPGYCHYLHSTMLLLYLNSHTKIIGNFLNLHSTMLLLYQLVPVGAHCLFHHLHSTMLLLYPKRTCCERDICPIYIPLCFYFIGW